MAGENNVQPTVIVPMNLDPIHPKDQSIPKKKKGRGFQNATQNRDALGKYEFESLEVTKTAGQAQRSIEGWILLVTGVNEEATEEDVQDKFADFGDIKNLHLNLDRRTGFVKGYALIEYESEKEAKAAIAGTQGAELLGSPIKCGFAFVRGLQIDKKKGKK